MDCVKMTALRKLILVTSLQMYLEHNMKFNLVYLLPVQLDQTKLLKKDHLQCYNYNKFYLLMKPSKN